MKCDNCKIVKSCKRSGAYDETPDKENCYFFFDKNSTLNIKSKERVKTLNRLNPVQHKLITDSMKLSTIKLLDNYKE